MENDIIDALEDIGYTGPIVDEEGCLEKALEGGPKSIEFSQLIEWISKELKTLCSLEEHVNAITSADDSSSFLLELSSFLKELGCAYTSLTSGHMSDRLNSRKKRLLLLDYLLSELEAARMISINKPDLSKAMQVHLSESSTASDLKNMLIALKFPKPPTNITPGLLFGKVEQKMKEVISKASPELVGKPLFTGVLSDKQWQQLGDLQTELQTEYRTRRELLIKRLDWSDRVKARQDEIAAMFLGRRKALVVEPEVHLSDLLSAREDLAVIEKTSNASVRKNTQSSINKVIIGRVVVVVAVEAEEDLVEAEEVVVEEEEVVMVEEVGKGVAGFREVGTLAIQEGAVDMGEAEVVMEEAEEDMVEEEVAAAEATEEDIKGAEEAVAAMEEAEEDTGDGVEEGEGEEEVGGPEEEGAAEGTKIVIDS
ncbi:Uncharacterized protein GBIM_01726 [Gryllus bimaculatus]|nr:Uncharacterized protein GBIM_01726 [Gryllus bimaculatus]